MFSRRRFVFRKNALVFCCAQGNLQEGQTITKNGTAAKASELTTPKWHDMREYRHFLQSFLKRDLHYPCDSLDVMAGITGILQSAFPSGFHFGLPELYFDIALLWGSTGPLVDRLELAKYENKSTKSLPSWSWARCKGPLDFEMWSGADECLFLSYLNQNYISISKTVQWFQSRMDGQERVGISSDHHRFRDCVRFEPGEHELQTPTGWTKSITGWPPLHKREGDRFGNPGIEFTHENIGEYPRFRFPIPLATNDESSQPPTIWSSEIHAVVEMATLGISPISPVNGKDQKDNWCSLERLNPAGSRVIRTRIGVAQLHTDSPQDCLFIAI